MSKVSCLRCWVPVEHRADAGDGPVEEHQTPAGYLCRPEVGRLYTHPDHPGRLFCMGASREIADHLRATILGGATPGAEVDVKPDVLVPYEADHVDLEALGRQICKRFESIEPDWAPPQFAMFLMARAEGMPVFYVDEQDEFAWLADWERRFDEAELDNEIELWTPHGSIYFEWVDCRKLKVDEIATDKPHWAGLTMDTDRRKAGRKRILKTAEQKVVGYIEHDADGAYRWTKIDGPDGDYEHEDEHDAFNDYCERFNR